LGKIREDCTVAINAASGSVGSAAIQICRILKAHPYVIVTTHEQIADCQKLGAKGGVSYKDADWPEQLKKQTEGRGFDLLLDSVFASQFKGSLDILATDAVWMVYAFQGGFKL
jgi:NADPH:quinone reductase-like Zn-dependent oxidoreductase